MKLPRVLFILPWIPKPDTNSADKRISFLIKLLAQDCAVDVCPRWGETGGTYSTSAVEIDRYRAEIAKLGATLVGSGAMDLLRTLAGSSYDIIIFELYGTARRYLGLCRRLQPSARLVVDSVDVHYLREEAGAAIGIFPLHDQREAKLLELATYRAADAVLVISDEDRRALLSAGKMPPMYLVPNVLEVHERASGERAREAVFVGGFGHAPNVDGICWFVREIWPLVLRRVPDAQVIVLGSHPKPEVSALAATTGVSVVGYVPDVRPFLDRAAVSIAPLRFGGGMKGKVTEAMSLGLAVVTTTFGAQGYAIKNGEDMIVADEPDEFAAGVVALLGDAARAERIGLAGQRLMASTCSPDAVAAVLREMLANTHVTRPAGLVLPYRLMARAVLKLLGPLWPLWKRLMA